MTISVLHKLSNKLTLQTIVFVTQQCVEDLDFIPLKFLFFSMLHNVLSFKAMFLIV